MNNMTDCIHDFFPSVAPEYKCTKCGGIAHKKNDGKFTKVRSPKKLTSNRRNGNLQDGNHWRRPMPGH